ncbi:NAD(P)-dependent dehydrogenase (short-subunit alcohol dehydrogenase family) [Motilibacter peucedani]|uniref:NAD(P)-dependent dehydrogenase (Short-subunit alcohol dehydrogenase family) n=1 Tax=Motilibacter peucedani TaxID=598650 RepID=A0A420XT43_9ACTN|nr:SDR family oxidoreductase [Motilibacter peucedani]RKS79937.1 NAD(P)-dependent dehydrogenase (short-subunit alcohol dehydrogenase family) [Motilibacter peucedani]
MPTPTALITGGTTGIGRATAELLHGRGHRVIVTGRDPSSVATARSSLPEGIEVVRSDAASMPCLESLVELVQQRLGTLDVLFLNAGITRPGPTESFDEAVYDELFAVNTKSAFFTLARTLPLLRDGASVIVTVGLGAARGVVGGAATAGSRGALLAMVPSLALELAPRRIRVNAVSPGAVRTGIWAKSGLAPDALEAALASYAANIPFGRLASARDVAEVVAFLASDAAGYITGENITVSGGSGLRP